MAICCVYAKKKTLHSQIDFRLATRDHGHGLLVLENGAHRHWRLYVSVDSYRRHILNSCEQLRLVSAKFAFACQKKKEKERKMFKHEPAMLWFHQSVCLCPQRLTFYQLFNCISSNAICLQWFLCIGQQSRRYRRHKTWLQSMAPHCLCLETISVDITT